MLKTKLFQGYLIERKEKGFPRDFVDVDEEINFFLDENKKVEVVDIKLTSVVVEGEIFNRALLIYKEKRPNARLM